MVYVKSLKLSAKRLTAVLLTLAFILPFMQINSQGAEMVTEVFKNTSGDGGMDIISMTELRTFEAVVEISKETESTGLIWYLEREKEMQDEKLFPYQYLGAALSDWTVWGKTDKLFNNIKSLVFENGGKTYAKVTFENAYFFGSGNITSTRSNRNVILDYTGTYELKCKDSSGKVCGSIGVELNPYDSFRSNEELSQSLAEAKIYGDSISGVYVQPMSLGTSTQGYDMPYVIISDSKASIEGYQEMTELAMKDPESLIKKIKAGKLDYKIPVLYSNVHADEHPGADAPMNFIWDILKAMDSSSKTISYDNLTGFTSEGQAQLKTEMQQDGIVWPELISEYATGLGYIKGGNTSSGIVDLEKYYTIETKELNVKELLEDIILIVVPEENTDGRTNSVRQNGNGFDLNRDNMFQTQTETQLMTTMIAQWNPAAFIELHGFVGGFQVEPCSPPHEPNFEYDLFAENALKGGEAFGVSAVANNDTFNSYVMPLRDYLEVNSEGQAEWISPWDDMSTNYTPQYSMLHGTVAYTIEVPQDNQDAVTALEYGLINHAAYVAQNKDDFYINQLTVWLRGINNIDSDEISSWYVDVFDNEGAEADVYRPKYDGNNNFFPECYIIPLDAENQSNLAAAYEMQAHFLRNGVEVSKLKSDITIDGVKYLKGSMVISMYQAKRNVANSALYDGVLITTWPDLYSEPITAFGKMRGFDCTAIDTVGAVTESMLEAVTEVQTGETAFSGVKNGQVVIDNDSIDAIAMANEMIDDGVKVGFITSGDDKTDFVVSYNDFIKYSGKYIVTAEGTLEAPQAKLISNAVIYIPGFAGEYSKDSAGNPYGVYNYPNYGNTNYNFDRFAYGQQMGFDLTLDPSQADVIAGNRSADSAALEAVKSGTPYLAAGVGALETVKSQLLGAYGFDYVSTGTNQDCFFTVTYDTDSLTTAGYKAEGDNLVYSYGGAYISAVPTGGTVLMTATDETPIEGFIKQENLDKFLGSVQAIAYASNGLDVTVFSGSLTNKAHQQDDYQFAANTIFAKSLGADYTSCTGGEGCSIAQFTDVDITAWYHAALDKAVSEGLLEGVGSGKLDPNGTMTRAMLVTVLYRAAGSPAVSGSTSFTDVKSGEWYYNAVIWAYSNGIVTGYSDTQYAPDVAIKREEMAAMIYRLAKSSGLSVSQQSALSAYTDSQSVSSYAASAVSWANSAGIMTGYKGELSPQAGATRAEAAAMLTRYLAIEK
ncbi:MAG: M14 family metallopeptidase [Clostridiaceae bacterium]|nr:M14 family metallopeptidase [Clostridiaceae bacterium]